MNEDSRVKWYMRIFLVFHAMHTETNDYTRSGMGLRMTIQYKKCCDEHFVYEVTQEFYELKGKHNRRARRAKK